MVFILYFIATATSCIYVCVISVCIFVISISVNDIHMYLISYCHKCIIPDLQN